MPKIEWITNDATPTPQEPAQAPTKDTPPTSGKIEWITSEQPSKTQQNAAEDYATKSWDWFTGGQGVSNLPERVARAGKDFLNAGIAYGEAGIQLVTGLGSAAVGATVGAAKEGYEYLTEDNYKGGEAYMAAFTGITNKFTYPAQTDHGKYLEGLIGVPFEYMAEKGIEAGDYVYAKTGNAAAAASVRTAVEGSIYVLPYLGAKGKQRVQARMEEKATKKLLAEKKVEELQYEARQKVLDKQEKAELERKIKERFDEVSAEHKGIKTPREAEVAPRSGAEILMTESDIIPFKDYLQTWKEANGISGKAKIKKETMKGIESEYADYKSRALGTIQYQYNKALAELKGDTFRDAPGESALPVGYIAHLRSKVAAEVAAEARMAGARESFGKYASKEKKIQQEARIYDEAERRYQEQLANQEDIAWAEKGILDAEERIDILLNRSQMPFRTPVQEAINDHISSRGKMGRQRGAMDPMVFAEGLIKAGEKGAEFTEKMVKEFGDQWRTLSPALYQTLIEKGASAEQQSQKVHEVIKQKAEKQMRRESMMESGKFIPSFVEIIGGQAITKLRRKATDNPHLKEIIDSIEKPETVRPGEITKPDLTAAYHTETGRLFTALDNAIHPLANKIFPGVRETMRGMAKLPKKVNEKLATKLREPRLKQEVEAGVVKGDKYVDAASQIRKVLDDVVGMARSVGIELGYLDGYLPRIYNWRRIKSNKAAFQEDITPFVRDPIIRESIYDHLVEREGLMMPDNSRSRRSAFTMGKDGPARSGNLEMERQLHFIPDHILEPWLENDVYSIVTKYIETSVGRIEAARRFGPNEEILYDKLNRAIEHGAKTGKPITQMEVNRLFNLIDAHSRNWIAIENPSIRTGTRASVAFMNAVTLPLAVFTSMPEAMLPLYHGGIKAYAKAIPPTLATAAANSARAIYAGMPKTYAQKFSEMMLKSSDLAATERVSAMYNGDVNAINSITFRANFLHTWTKTMNILSAETFRAMTNDFLKAEAKGKAKGKSDRWWNKAEHERMRTLLNRLGMDVNEGIKWVERGMPKEGDPFFDTQYRTAAVNFVHDNVMTSRPSVRPMWHSIPHLAPLAHLKGFPSMFGNIVMKRAYHDTIGEFRQRRYYSGMRNTAYALGTGYAMLMVADMAYDIKDRAKYGGNLPASRLNETTFERYMRLTDSAGFLGGWSTVKAGLTAKTEWGGTSWMAMLGPTVAKSGDLLDGFYTGMSGGGWRPYARSLINITPGVSINRTIKAEAIDEVEAFLNEVYPPDSKGRTTKRTRKGRSTR